MVPSLVAVTSDVFEEIDRPDAKVNLPEIIQGLIEFRKEYKGHIWLEIMIIKGVNDRAKHIKLLKNIVDRINPVKIQINSPVRYTAETDILPASKKRLEKYVKLLGPRCEVV